MDTKALATVAVIAAVVGGVVGGLVGAAAGGGKLPDTLKVNAIEAQSIKSKLITGDEIVSSLSKDEETHIKGGGIIATKYVVANDSVVGGTVRGNLMATQNLQLVRNPTVGDINQWQIYADLAIRQGGAALVLRNAQGILTHGAGAADKGNSTYIGYSDNGLPVMYVHDHARGNAGVSPVYVPKVLTPEEAAKEADKAKTETKK